MTKIYSYVLPYDFGVAPNPFWGLCTLTVCKPIIRKNAEVGDWVVGTGSVNAECIDGLESAECIDGKRNLSDRLIYAMKICKKIPLNRYDEFCKTTLPNKIPDWNSPDWRIRMGDCIYDYSNETLPPTQRGKYHTEADRLVDLGGENSLLSNHFYYFGSEAKEIRDDLKVIIKQKQGHRKIENQDIVERFEEWISEFEANKIYAEPLLHWKYLKQTEEDLAAFCSECAKQQMVDDKDDSEELIA